MKLEKSLEISSTIRCLVIGAGKMGVAHVQSLQQLIPGQYACFAPSERNRQSVEELGATFYSGDLDSAVTDYQPTHVIVASPIHILHESVIQILKHDIKHILVEKPSMLTVSEGENIKQEAGTIGASIYVAYNRRFYSSLEKASTMIQDSGESITSVSFEFTEVSSVIAAATQHDPSAKRRWILGNSLHVIDTAFFQAGLPDPQQSAFYRSGSLHWHPSAAVFSGAGITDQGIAFSYSANWDAPGRWGVEWCTRSMRYIFRPMEKLQVVPIGSFESEYVQIEDDLDSRFKPGVYLQNMHFLAENPQSKLVSLQEAIALVRLGQQIGGYPEE